MSASKYRVSIDPAEENTSHALILRLVGGNKRVLDVGCAEGDLARALAAAGCIVTGVEVDADAAELAEPACERVLVGDLEQLDLAAELGEHRYDVVVFGDVLEHLVHPRPVLQQAHRLLAPGGYVVISIPNIAHASVRLALLRGEFRYRDVGLLDDTHLRFFTRSSLFELLEGSGFAPVDVQRTTAGPFDTELQVPRDAVPPAVVEAVLRDPDATTYQFVLTAVPADAHAGVAALSRERDELRRQVDDLTTQLAGVQREVVEVRAAAMADERRAAAAAAARAAAATEQLQRLEAERRDLETERDRLEMDVVTARREADTWRGQLQAVHASTAWRVSAPVRALGPLRTALQGPASTRRSLRRGGVEAITTSLREQGLVATAARVRRSLAAPGARADYLDWVAEHDTLDDADRAAVRRHVAAMPRRPLLSVVMPAYNSDPRTLKEAVASVIGQLYEHWELCIADDASPSAETRDALDRIAALDERIRLVRREENGGIATATNDALAACTGEFVALLDHDDVLAEHALYLMAVEVSNHPDADIVYSDEDKLDAEGRRCEPNFKPDLNLELLLSQNCISHLGMYRTALLRKIGGLRTGVEGSQDHDLVLRALAASGPDRVRHVPHVLYHWRQWSGSGTFSSTNLDKAAAASRAAVQEHLDARGEDAVVEPSPHVPSWNRPRWSLPSPTPRVTVVVPTRDRVELLRACVDGLLHGTDYPALELLIVDNDSTDPATLAYLAQVVQDERVQVLPVPGPFNFSRLNNLAVSQAESPLVLLLNNDIVVREPGWLAEMVSLVVRPGVGAVGARLLYADGRVQHGGVLLGVGGVANHAHKLFGEHDPGYFGRAVLMQEVSAVTAACLLTRRDLYLRVGGFDEENLAVAFNDVDFCLKVREAGERVLYTPYAELFHLESVSRGDDNRPEHLHRFHKEIAHMQARWGGTLRNDPAYNPNLSDTTPDFSLASPPRSVKPWLAHR